MMKKITILFAVLTALCAIATIPLIPFAVRDTVNMVSSELQQLHTPQQIASYPLGDEVTHLNLESSISQSRIRIVHSDEKEITVYSDSISRAQPYVQQTVSANYVTLSLGQSSTSSIFPQTSQEIRSTLARLWANDDSSQWTISIPDGLVLTYEEQDPSRYVSIDGDVRYLTQQDMLEPPAQEPETDHPGYQTKEEFTQQVYQLREDLLTLVRLNAEGGYDQLEFNMQLNDCRIRMETLLMAYAEEEDLINYHKYDETPSAITGISGVILTPYDDSVDESEARSTIHELCVLYLSRLTVQAKLDFHVAQSSSNPDDAYLQQQNQYQKQIDDYTASIQELEEQHPDFMMGLMNSGLLF